MLMAGNPAVNHSPADTCWLNGCRKVWLCVYVILTLHRWCFVDSYSSLLLFAVLVTGEACLQYPHLTFHITTLNIYSYEVGLHQQ